MHGQVDAWMMGGRVVGWQLGRMDGWLGLVGEWVDGLPDSLYGWVDKTLNTYDWVCGWISGWIDLWICNGWSSGLVDVWRRLKLADCFGWY